MTWLLETLDVFDIFWTLLYILLSIQNEAEKVVSLRHHRLFLVFCFGYTSRPVARALPKSTHQKILPRFQPSAIRRYVLQ